NFSGADLDSQINLSNNHVGISSENLHQTFNTSANITIFNLSYEFQPVVYKDGLLCTTPLCNITGYGEGELNFTASGFSDYNAGENSILDTWDSADNKGGGNVIYPDENAVFTANYTNTTGNTINATNISCNITFSDSPDIHRMSYSKTTRLYTYIRNFPNSISYQWNVTCNGTALGYEIITESDSITITCEESWSCEAWSSCSGGTQTRTCTDANSCGTTLQRPSLSQSCTDPSDDSPSSGSPSSSPSGGTSPSLPSTSNTRTKAWLKIDENKTVIWNVGDFEVTRVDVKAKSLANNPKMTVKVLEAKPDSVSYITGSYEYFEIESENLDPDETKIIFRVKNDWLESNNKDYFHIKLSRYEDSWVDIPTKYLNQDETYSYFESSITSFGTFAVRTDQPVQEYEETPLQNETSQAAHDKIPETYENNTMPENITNEKTSENKETKKTELDFVKIGITIVILISITVLAYFGAVKYKSLSAEKNKASETNSYQKEKHKEDDIEKIVDYISKAKKLGITNEDIIKELADVGWPTQKIQKAFDRYNSTSQSKEVIQKKITEEEEKMIEYIKKTSALGIKDDDIINELLNVGWDKKIIDEAYKKYKSKNPNPSKQI
ncbi:MAG: PGF-pre-PGF domain-containing protein, partial [Candidatus Woesearchaeota archaeon]